MKISADAGLVAMLEMYVAMFPEGQGDNLYAMVLREGREFVPGFLPAAIKRGTPRQCFDNSIEINKRYGLAYAEGFAVSRVVGMPIHHAWNVTADGVVVDATWVPEGLEYYGVIVDLENAASESFLTPLGVMTD